MSFNISIGWQCPRCSAINSPSIAQCPSCGPHLASYSTHSWPCSTCGQMIYNSVHHVCPGTPLGLAR